MGGQVAQPGLSQPKLTAPMLCAAEGFGGGGEEISFAVLDAAGNSYTAGPGVLDSAGASYSVPQSVLGSDGTSYMVN